MLQSDAMKIFWIVDRADLFPEISYDESSDREWRNRIKTLLYATILIVATAVVAAEYGGGYSQTVTVNKPTLSQFHDLNAAAHGAPTCPCSNNIVNVGAVAAMQLMLSGWCDHDYTNDPHAMRTALTAFCLANPNYPGANSPICNAQGQVASDWTGTVDTFCGYYHSVRSPPLRRYAVVALKKRRFFRTSSLVGPRHLSFPRTCRHREPAAGYSKWDSIRVSAQHGSRL